MHLIENGVSEQTAHRIQTLIDKDGSFEDVIDHLEGFTKSQTEVMHHSFELITNIFLSGIEIIERDCRRISDDCSLCSCFRCDDECMSIHLLRLSIVIVLFRYV